MAEDKEKKAVQVVAALIWREGRFMICQRPKHKARSLLWEFVGGKTHALGNKGALGLYIII